MDELHYKEMMKSLDEHESKGNLAGKRIYLFGHCDATENLVNVLQEKKYAPVAILDNNINKHGNRYKGIPIVSPAQILTDDENTVVCIVARAYASMSAQLRELGYVGDIYRLVNYNSFSEYSLSEETIEKMRSRERIGEALFYSLKRRHGDAFFLLCPFCALGDVYIMMSYLPMFMKKRNIRECVICVIGKACAEVVSLFGVCEIEIFSQDEMDKVIQAALFLEDNRVFIPHQDRPYVVDLYKALYVKRIPLNRMYCCGVFGLPADTVPVSPACFTEYEKLYEIPKEKAVILSPYAKSVTAIAPRIWKEIVEYYTQKGFVCFTNVVGDEKPLDGTTAISPKISEVQSVVERAGVFVGIRSGLCDVLLTANAKKIALYPDYNYSDTKWKAIEMYFLDGWDNRVIVGDDYHWCFEIS